MTLLTWLWHSRGWTPPVPALLRDVLPEILILTAACLVLCGITAASAGVRRLLGRDSVAYLGEWLPEKDGGCELTLDRR
jgi:hypothetical protein